MSLNYDNVFMSWELEMMITLMEQGFKRRHVFRALANNDFIFEKALKDLQADVTALDPYASPAGGASDPAAGASGPAVGAAAYASGPAFLAAAADAAVAAAIAGSSAATARPTAATPDRGGGGARTSAATARSTAATADRGGGGGNRPIRGGLEPEPPPSPGSAGRSSTAPPASRHRDFRLCSNGCRRPHNTRGSECCAKCVGPSGPHTGYCNETYMKR